MQRASSQDPRNLDRPLAGVLCLVAGIAIFSVQDLVLKVLSGAYPVHQAMVFRSVVALPLLLALVAWDGGLRTIRSPRAPLLALRGMILFSAYTSYYLGLAALPMSLCISLYFAGPLFTTILSALFLRESITPARWAAVTLGFAGILIVLRPGGALFDAAAILPIYSGFAYAVTAVLARSLRGNESAPTMAFYGNAVYMVGGLLMGAALAHVGSTNNEHRSLAFLLRGWEVPTTRDLVLLAICGAVAAFGTVLLTQAYRLAEASAVAPYEYTALFWSLLYGWIMWGEFPDTVSWIGMAIVILSGIYALSSRTPGRTATE